MDTEVEIYFTSCSVRLLARGVAERLYPGPTRRQSVYAFMQEAARHGAKFFACPQAMEEHGVSENQFIPEVTGTAGAASYMGRCLEAGWVSLVY